MGTETAIQQTVRAAISNAYYDARNEGETMETAADRAAATVDAIYRPLIDAARERPSALDAPTLTGAMTEHLRSWQEPDGTFSRGHSRCNELCVADLAERYARLTEPDAGEGTERLTSTDQLEAEQRGLPIPFAPTPDTTEATLRAILRSSLEVGHGPYLGSGATYRRCACAVHEDAFRAALQQPAVQPEPNHYAFQLWGGRVLVVTVDEDDPGDMGEPRSVDDHDANTTYLSVRAVQPEGGPE